MDQGDCEGSVGGGELDSMGLQLRGWIQGEGLKDVWGEGEDETKGLVT